MLFILSSLHWSNIFINNALSAVEPAKGQIVLKKFDISKTTTETSNFGEQYTRIFGEKKL